MPREYFNTDNRVEEREDGFKYKTVEGTVLAKLRVGQVLPEDHHIGVGPSDLDMESDELGTTYLIMDPETKKLTVALFSGEMTNSGVKKYTMLLGVDKKCDVRAEDLRYYEPHVLLPPVGAGWDEIKFARVD